MITAAHDAKPHAIQVAIPAFRIGHLGSATIPSGV